VFRLPQLALESVWGGGDVQMVGFCLFCFRALQNNTVAAIIGAVMTAIGFNYQTALAAVFPHGPPPFLKTSGIEFLIVGLGLLGVAYAFYRQLMDQKDDSPQIRRLRLQPYSTFDEIGTAISQADSAYSKEEIIERLLQAALNKEFYSLEHHSRMKIKPHPKSERYGGNPPRFYLKDRSGLPESADQYSDGTVVYETNLILGNLNKDNFDPDGQIMIERGDFARWYRRFRSGRYEG
jgi:hypothetical protein